MIEILKFKAEYIHDFGSRKECSCLAYQTGLTDWKAKNEDGPRCFEWSFSQNTVLRNEGECAEWVEKTVYNKKESPLFQAVLPGFYQSSN